jgi:hypothetical protein
MLRFAVHQSGKAAATVDLTGAYLVGGDGVPVRADIEFKNGEIVCRKRAAGPAALALLWPTNGGRVLLETTRLPERDKPYILQLELLRGRLMRIAQKREDWGLHDFEGTEEIAKQVDHARDLLIEGLQAESPASAATVTQRGLMVSMLAGEALTTFHAEIFLGRRKQVGGFPKRLFGVQVEVGDREVEEAQRKHLKNVADFITLPFIWRDIEPREKEFHWEAYDRWVDWAVKNRIPIRGGNLVAFNTKNIPDWLYIWEHDFETVRDLTYEHIRRIIERYGQHIAIWDVISGIHAVNCFSFNFEQLMELTRMSTALTKKLAPRSTAVINIVTPWGEYYATNQRTIPPLLYAEMIVQSGVNFDAFGLECCLGVGVEGMMVRDLLQISSLIDRFAGFGKPVHLTAVGAPSGGTPDTRDAWGGKHAAPAGGAWHKDWTEEIQRAWMRRVYHIALSKPFVEAISWRDLCDNASHMLPHGGLINAEGAPKLAYQELTAIRREMSADPRRAQTNV